MKKTLLFFAIIVCNLSGFSQAPTLNITQPTCAVPVGTVQVVSPLSNDGPVATNLYISEVTDANLGGLSYIEIFNATGATVNLSNYKLKIYANGSSAASCDLTLSGSVSNHNVFVVAVGSTTNLGGVTPNLTFAACAGFNTNDAVMLTTISDVAIDLWGSTSGTVFTPLGQAGYTYRRHIDAPAPSLVWNPADWDAFDPEDYTNVGTYSTAVNYVYSIDGGAFQTSPFFNQLPPGPHVIVAQNSGSGTSGQTSFDIVAIVPGMPVTNFLYPSPICQSNSLLAPILPVGFTYGGVFLATQPLAIDASSGIINMSQTPPGNYLISYAVAPNNTPCLLPGTYTFNLIVLPTSATPQGLADQTLSFVNPTLTNVIISPANVSWYDSYQNALGLNNPLPIDMPLVDGATYYAVNTISGCPSSPFAVTVHLPLSTNTFADFSFEIAPNPASSLLTMQTKNHQHIDKIVISDMSGKSVIIQTPTNNTVNVEQLAAGMYLLEGFSGEQKFQSKFVKQ